MLAWSSSQFRQLTSSLFIKAPLFIIFVSKCWQKTLICMIFFLINTRLENTSKDNNKDKRATSTVFPAVLHTGNGGMQPLTPEIWYNWGIEKISLFLLFYKMFLNWMIYIIFNQEMYIMKTFTEKCSKKEALCNKGLWKTLVKIHERCPWASLLKTVQVV